MIRFCKNYIRTNSWYVFGSTIFIKRILCSNIIFFETLYYIQENPYHVFQYVKVRFQLQGGKKGFVFFLFCFKNLVLVLNNILSKEEKKLMLRFLYSEYLNI